MFKEKDIIVKRESLENVNFTNRKNPMEGIVSLAIGIVSIIIFLALCIVSTVNKGNGESWIGLIGCLTGMGNVLGLYLAIKALKKEDVYHKITTIGLAINGLVSIGYLTIYVWGLFIS